MAFVEALILPRPPINLHQKVREVVQHVSPLHAEADRPVQHFERSVNAGLQLLAYLDAHIDPNDVYAAVYERHLSHLRRLILAEFIEAFERFLKELAALCVDYLAPYTTDDRFDDFVPRRGDKIAAFVNAPTLGKALCEMDTWLNNSSINARFASLLKEPAGNDWEFLFPQANQQPAAERQNAATLAILWQIRHNLAHNVGVLTHSDSMKFRVLVGGPVTLDTRLAPSMEDIRFVKRFLSERASSTNERIGHRVAHLLTGFHTADGTLFDARTKANEVSQRFAFSVTVHGQAGVV
jgi:hypothetical protein